MRIETGFHPGPSPAPEFAARHYSVKELAALWGLSERTVRAIFQDEPGVMVLEPLNGKRSSRRRYRTFRIPEAIAARVYARLKRSA